MAAMAALLGAVAASAVVLSRHAGQRAAATEPALLGPTGAWFCPHGGSPGWNAWVIVTNPGERAVRVRLTSLGDSRARTGRSFLVPGLRQVFRQVPSDELASATQVEYFGGRVAAAAVVRSGGTSPAVAGEICVESPSPEWLLPRERGGERDSRYVVVMNPFGHEAQFEVSIRTERRLVKPPELAPFVLGARRSVAIPLNRFLVQGPEEHAAAVQVLTRVGRVVAGGLDAGEGGLRAEAGIPRPSTSWIFPGGAYVGEIRMPAFNPGTTGADLSVVTQGPSKQHLVTGPASSLGAGEVRTMEFPDSQAAGVVVSSTNRTPLAVVRTMAGSRGDSSILNGSPMPRSSWLVLPSMPPERGSSVLLLQNPGRVPATLGVRLIGEDGIVEARGFSSIEVAPGTTKVLRLPTGPHGRPVSAVVTARDGTIVAAAASYSSLGRGYAAALGVPIETGREG